MVLTSCHLDHPMETLEDDAELEFLAKQLINLWRSTILAYGTLPSDDIDIPISKRVNLISVTKQFLS